MKEQRKGRGERVEGNDRGLYGGRKGEGRTEGREGGRKAILR